MKVKDDRPEPMEIHTLEELRREQERREQWNRDHVKPKKEGRKKK